MQQYFVVLKYTPQCSEIKNKSEKWKIAEADFVGIFYVF